MVFSPASGKITGRPRLERAVGGAAGLDSWAGAWYPFFAYLYYRYTISGGTESANSAADENGKDTKKMFKLPVFTIDQLVRRMETEYPQRVAMRYYDEAQQKVQEMTYGQYAHDIRCVAAELQDKIPDIEGKRVCILAGNSYHYAATIFGTVLAGAVVVPLNRQKSWDDIQYEVNLVEAAAILHDGSYLELEPALERYTGTSCCPSPATSSTSPPRSSPARTGRP